MTTPKIPTTRNKQVKKSTKSAVKNTTTTARPIIKKITKKIPLPTPPSRAALLQKNSKIHPTKDMWTLPKIIIILLLIWGLLWMYKWSIMWSISWDQWQQPLIINQDDDVLFVGKNIQISGSIEKTSTKKYNYTHTINDQIYGTLWLRSTTMNLNSLSGLIQIEWQIIDFVNNTYIIDVTQAAMLSQDKETSSSSLLYFPLPWLLIQNMASEWFTITNQESSTTNTISINNAATKAQVTIRYFVCSTDQAYDCQRFQDTFESTVGVQFTDSYNNKFYKLKDANTWFVNLDNNYGIYIETSSEALLTMIIQNIQFVTKQRAKNTLIPLAKTLCVWSWLILNEVIDSNIVYEKNNTTWNVQWISQNYEPIVCSISIKPLDLGSSSLLSFGKKQATIETVKPTPSKEIPVIQPTDISKNNISLTNSNITPQIPLKSGKELLFSTKGLSISFPTPNIAFESANISKVVKGLSCATSTNIVLYSNKSNIKTNPSVTMYFCKNGTPTDTNNVRVINTANTTIIVEIFDPAWVDFINNIKLNS